jgi:hypothetical protein
MAQELIVGPILVELPFFLAGPICHQTRHNADRRLNLLLDIFVAFEQGRIQTDARDANASVEIEKS